MKTALEKLNLYPALRLVALMATVLTSAVGITWKVSSNINATLRSLDLYGVAQAANKEDIKKNTRSIEKNQEAIAALNAFRHRTEGALGLDKR